MEVPPDKDAIDIVEETQEFAPKKSDEEFKVGDKVVHSRSYLGICRGTHRKKVEAAVYEIIYVTARSIGVRPWGSTQKYGSQYERRYIVHERK
jgi:hypothetical protein